MPHRGTGRSAPPAPTAASAAACWRRLTARAARRSPAIPTIPPISAGCARRARRSARRWAWRPGCCIPQIGGRRVGWDEAHRPCRRQHRAHGQAHGPEAIAFYLSGPAADRGLLRRQQAGQGLHRHAARRHQLAPVHGLLRGRPPPRVRRRHRAAVLRRPGACRPRGAGRLQRGLVPSGALPAHPGGAGRARRARRQHRSAAHRHQRGRRPASGDQARHRCPAVERPARAGSATTARSTGASSTSIRRALQRRWRARAGKPDVVAQVARATGLGAGDIEQFYGWWTSQRAGRHLLFAGREPVGARHRQGQRHHQLPPGHRPHRQAGRGAAVAHRPAQRHGRARGRRARQHAGRAHGLLGARARSRAPLLGCAEPRRGRGPQGRADVRGRGRRPTSSAVGDGHQSRRQPAARRSRARGAAGGWSCWSCRRTSPATIRRTWRRCGCRRRRGARRTARSPTPSGASRASGRSCRLPGEARPDWWILSQVAARLGWAEAFSYRSAADVFREHARLSGFENDGERLFDISGLAGLSDAQYAALGAGAMAGAARRARDTERLFGDGTFAYADRPRPLRRHRERADRGRRVPRAWPFVLNTGRVRDQWHTMTRTGLSARLCRARLRAVRRDAPRRRGGAGARPGHAGARRDGARGGAAARHAERAASSRARCSCRSTGRRENSSAGRIGALVQPRTDPFSGQPDAKATPARIGAVPVSHYGFVLSRRPVPMTGLGYWARARMPAGYATLIALDAPPEGWSAWSQTPAAGRRAPHLRGRALASSTAPPCCAMGASRRCSTLPPSPMPAVDGMAQDLLRPAGISRRRPPIAAGGASGRAARTRDRSSAPASRSGASASRPRLPPAQARVAEIGVATRAGTNCGSCVPELKRLVGAAAAPLRQRRSRPMRQIPPRETRAAAHAPAGRPAGVRRSGGQARRSWRAPAMRRSGRRSLLAAAGARVEVFTPDPCAELDALVASAAGRQHRRCHAGEWRAR